MQSRKKRANYLGGKRESGTKVVSIRDFAARRLRRGVHVEQDLGGEPRAFSLGRVDERSPILLRDGLTLPPLVDGPCALTDRIAELGRRSPDIDQVFDGVHLNHNASDELSGQGRTTYPVTPLSRKGTICPMGRGTTKADFIADFCRRTAAAREMAGFSDRDAFAKLLGVLPDTYGRYETRTPLPHRYMPRFLELTGADAQVLFTGTREVKRKTG